MRSSETITRREANPVHVYRNREPYRQAAGSESDRQSVEDRLADAVAMVALDKTQPSAGEFFRLCIREMKIRAYARNTMSSYRGAIRSILRWFGRPPHLLDREHVKNYLEYLYDGGHSPSDMAVQLTAIRNAWDKFCYRDVTLGLATPRQKRRRLVVVSRDEVRRLLQSARSLRDTLLIGLMYGTGVRVSEVCRLRWRDIDLDRNQIFIWQGKGNADRHVQLPQQYRELLRRLGDGRPGEAFLFPGQSASDHRTDRHLNTRTVQRVVREATETAGIQKQVTPHSLRHAFATHSFEDGCDIRRIQKVLGHVRLETTTIYVTVAKQRTDFPSPLDRLQPTAPSASNETPPSRAQPAPTPVVEAAFATGTLRLHTRPDPSLTDQQWRQTRRTQITVGIHGKERRDFLLGTIAEMPREGFITIHLPPFEEWEDQLAALPDTSRKWLNDPDFYKTLQAEITNRMLSDHKSTPSRSPPINTPTAKPR